MAKNPFILDIFPEVFVGYEQQKKEILSALSTGEKFLLLVGDVGVGKTTMVHWLKDNTDLKIYYFPRPPKDISLVEKEIFSSFWRLLFRFNSEHRGLRKLSSPVLVVIDEFHEATDEFIEELRSFADNTQNLYVLAVVLPEGEEKIKEKHKTLYSRITTRIYLDRLNKNEVYQLIKSRIELHGGRGIEPFTTDVINYIYESTQGIPREILKLSSYYYRKSVENNIHVIDMSFIESLDSTPREEKISSFSKSRLTPKQEEILSLIRKHKQLSPPEIVSLIDSTEYASELHALRAINNILRKLESEGYVKRKRDGRRYVYYVF